MTQIYDNSLPFFAAACEALEAFDFMEEGLLGVDMEKMQTVYGRFGLWTEDHTQALIEIMPIIIDMHVKGKNFVWILSDLIEHASRAEEKQTLN